jgi:prepilin-type processing-associated H-X9-DG protein
MEGLRVEFTDLENKTEKTVIAKTELEYKVVEYINLRYPARNWWGWTGPSPDVLSRRKIFFCEPEKNTVLWVTVKVPQDAAAGNYAGKIKIIHGQKAKDRGEERGMTETVVSLHLQVFDFLLFAGGKMADDLLRKYNASLNLSKINGLPGDIYTNIKMDWIKHPGKKVFFCDFLDYYSSKSQFSDPANVTYPHNGGLNFIFADGHIEWGAVNHQYAASNDYWYPLN